MIPEIEHLVEEISAAATEVYSALKAGYAETIYEEAMAVELEERGLSYELERTTEVRYKGHKVGTHRLDLVVKGLVVVELKAATSLSKSHKAQLASYLRTIGLEVGVLVNFPYPEADQPTIHVEDVS